MGDNRGIYCDRDEKNMHTDGHVDQVYSLQQVVGNKSENGLNNESSLSPEMEHSSWTGS